MLKTLVLLFAICAPSTGPTILVDEIVTCDPQEFEGMCDDMPGYLCGEDNRCHEACGDELCGDDEVCDTEEDEDGNAWSVCTPKASLPL